MPGLPCLQFSGVAVHTCVVFLLPRITPGATFYDLNLFKRAGPLYWYFQACVILYYYLGAFYYTPLYLLYHLPNCALRFSSWRLPYRRGVVPNLLRAGHRRFPAGNNFHLHLYASVVGSAAACILTYLTLPTDNTFLPLLRCRLPLPIRPILTLGHFLYYLLRATLPA